MRSIAFVFALALATVACSAQDSSTEVMDGNLDTVIEVLPVDPTTPEAAVEALTAPEAEVVEPTVEEYAPEAVEPTIEEAPVEEQDVPEVPIER